MLAWLTSSKKNYILPTTRSGSKHGELALGIDDIAIFRRDRDTMIKAHVHAGMVNSQIIYILPLINDSLLSKGS